MSRVLIMAKHAVVSSIAIVMTGSVVTNIMINIVHVVKGANTMANTVAVSKVLLSASNSKGEGNNERSHTFNYYNFLRIQIS